MAPYAPSSVNTYSDAVFPHQLYVPLLVGDLIWDYMAQNDQCKAPPDYAAGPNCSNCGDSGGSSSGNGTNSINTGWYGVKHQTERDFIGEGTFPLHFERYYVSRKQSVPGVGTATPLGLPPTAAWGYTYANKIILTGAKSSATDSNPKPLAYAYRPDGRIYIFDKSGTNWVSSLPEVTHQLKQLTDGSWQYITNNDETETYDPSGKLLSIKNRTGLTHTLTYTAAGITVADSFGRTLNIGLISGNVKNLATPNGEVYTYALNGNMVTTVTYPDNTVRTYEYSGGQYLSGIVDEKGVRIAAWSYDADFRAISSEHGGGTDKYTIAYSGPLASTTPGSPVTVTDPKGVARLYTYVPGGGGSGSGGQGSGIVKLKGSTQPCNTCTNGSIAAATYDASDLELIRK
jgi:YD repeat-containing protein